MYIFENNEAFFKSNNCKTINDLKMTPIRNNFFDFID